MIPGSANRVSVTAGIRSEVNARDTTDCCDGSNRVTTGSSISTGKSARRVEIASRMSCDATWMSFS